MQHPVFQYPEFGCTTSCATRNAVSQTQCATAMFSCGTTRNFAQAPVHFFATQSISVLVGLSLQYFLNVVIMETSDHTAAKPFESSVPMLLPSLFPPRPGSWQYLDFLKSCSTSSPSVTWQRAIDAPDYSSSQDSDTSLLPDWSAVLKCPATQSLHQ